MNHQELARRAFLRAGALAGAGLALGKPAYLFATPQLPALIKRNIQESDMAYIRLGRTDMLVSRLSLGGLPWEQAAARTAIERGVNLVHGSLFYGGNEKSVGKTIFEQAKTLKGQWDKVFYLLKWNEMTEDYVDQSLKALGTDHVDMLVPMVNSAAEVHSPARVETFEKLKAKGKVRFLGFAVHTTKEPISGVVDAGVAEGCYAAFLTMAPPAKAESLVSCLKRARAAGAGILSMKTLQGLLGGGRGYTANTKEKLVPALAVIERALTVGEVDTVTKGLANVIQAEEFTRIAAQCKPGHKIPASRSASGPAAKSAELSAIDPAVCGACGECYKACPNRLDLLEIMRCATYYGPELHEDAGAMYRALPRRFTAAACADCAWCEKACPRRLPIRRLIREADAKWGQNPGEPA